MNESEDRIPTNYTIFNEKTVLRNTFPKSTANSTDHLHQGGHLFRLDYCVSGVFSIVSIFFFLFTS